MGRGREGRGVSRESIFDNTFEKKGRVVILGLLALHENLTASPVPSLHARIANTQQDISHTLCEHPPINILLPSAVGAPPVNRKG